MCKSCVNKTVGNRLFSKVSFPNMFAEKTLMLSVPYFVRRIPSNDIRFGRNVVLPRAKNVFNNYLGLYLGFDGSLGPGIVRIVPVIPPIDTPAIPLNKSRIRSPVYSSSFARVAKWRTPHTPPPSRDNSQYYFWGPDKDW